jgi:hypothetical protein
MTTMSNIPLRIGCENIFTQTHTHADLEYPQIGKKDFGKKLGLPAARLKLGLTKKTGCHTWDVSRYGRQPSL